MVSLLFQRTKLQSKIEAFCSRSQQLSKEIKTKI